MNLNATLFAQLVVFFILAWFTMQFVWPPIVKALDERAKKIADGLAAAERCKNDLELATKRSTEALREGKEKAAELIANAEKRGAQLIEEAKLTASLPVPRLKSNRKPFAPRKLCANRWRLWSFPVQKRFCVARSMPRPMPTFWLRSNRICKAYG